MTAGMRDAWLLASAAIEAGRFTEAQAYADRAAELSEWDRYLLLGLRHGVELLRCRELPRDWTYLHHVGRHRRVLLLHPDGVAFLTETVGFATLVKALTPGLQRLDGLLAAVLRGAMEAPDTLEG